MKFDLLEANESCCRMMEIPMRGRWEQGYENGAPQCEAAQEEREEIGIAVKGED